MALADQLGCEHAVSVVVPVYNVERYLAQCLDSIASSLGRQLQLIIVDDGSTDASPAIARTFAERCKADASAPDCLLLTKENGGYGNAVNAGIAQADGRYIGIVEPDDYLAGDQFGALFDIARRCDWPDIVKATYRRVWMPDTSSQRIWGSLLRHRGVRTWQAGTTDLGESPQLVRWHPSVWSAIYRRDFLDAEQIRFIEAAGGGWVDNPFVMRAMCRARRIAFTDDAWYCYREDRPGSSSVTKAPHAVAHPLAADGQGGAVQPLGRRRGRGRIACRHRLPLPGPAVGHAHLGAARGADPGQPGDAGARARPWCSACRTSRPRRNGAGLPRRSGQAMRAARAATVCTCSANLPGRGAKTACISPASAQVSIEGATPPTPPHNPKDRQTPCTLP